jgi:hypothetical protein
MATKKASTTAMRRSAKRRIAQVRDHYRAFRIQKPNGKWYNPILDPVGHAGERRNTENIRGFAHGTVQGYRDAGCTYCDACASAGKADAEAREARRIDSRLDDHRGRVIRILGERFPGIDDQVIAGGADVVVSTHIVGQKFRALFKYHPPAVELALNNWALVSGVDLPVRDIPDLAATIIQELQR